VVKGWLKSHPFLIAGCAKNREHDDQIGYINGLITIQITGTQFNRVLGDTQVHARRRKVVCIVGATGAYIAKRALEETTRAIDNIA